MPNQTLQPAAAAILIFEVHRYATDRAVVPSRTWKYPFFRRAVYTVAAVAAILAMFCWYFRIQSARDLKAYVGMALECHPAWQDLALRRVYEGQSVDEAIAIAKPVYTVRHGRFVELGYQEPLSFTVVQMIAMDGKLVQAFTASCTWDYTFFDSMTDDHAQEMSDSFDNNERTLVYNGATIVRSPALRDGGATTP